ncbi:MAG: RagB/SusD family nutrient uptake outer membrane protein [Gemmatimonadetes bacterium]|nr:RagB/SusD family nutrient uptake outer membrane protein [Gemmatimonadota bacterium]
MSSRTFRWGAMLPTALLALVTACDTEVVNPGRVQEEFLLREEAQEAIVSGIGRAFSEAHNWVGYTGAAIAREIHPSGSTGTFGIAARWQNGELRDDEINTHWNLSQQARWLGDDGIAKIQDTGAVSQDLLAQAYLWTGYAYRLLGENFCQAVIDGGAAMDRSEYYTRAIDRFTQAETLGSGDLAMAAVAGRASVRAFMGDWAGAVADANAVPDGFSYMVPYFATEGDDTRNRIQWASQAEPYKAHTQRFTKYETYGLSDNNPSGDPRVPFMVTTETGDAATQCCGQVDWWPQQKYMDSGADIEISSSEEMRLIEAEYELEVNGDFAAAMTIINSLRTAAGVPAASASDITEAWTALKFERGVELWLEGRRLGDFFRWDRDATPGDRDPLEVPSGDQLVGSHLVQQDLCFPISEGEKDTNPNIS